MALNDNFKLAHARNLELSAKIATGQALHPHPFDEDFYLYYSLVDRLCLDDGTAVESVIAFICDCDVSPGRNDFDSVCKLSGSVIELKTNHITIKDRDALERAKVLQLQLNRSEHRGQKRSLSAQIKQLTGNKKFTMRGVFSDITKKSWMKYKTSEGALIHVALMLNERLIAVIEFPLSWSTFTDHVESQLERCVKDASFSPTQYYDCPSLKARWIITPDELKEIRFLFSGNNFELILRLANQYHLIFENS